MGRATPTWEKMLQVPRKTQKTHRLPPHPHFPSRDGGLRLSFRSYFLDKRVNEAQKQQSKASLRLASALWLSLLIRLRPNEGRADVPTISPGLLCSWKSRWHTPLQADKLFHMYMPANPHTSILTYYNFSRLVSALYALSGCILLFASCSDLWQPSKVCCGNVLYTSLPESYVPLSP